MAVYRITELLLVPPMFYDTVAIDWSWAGPLTDCTFFLCAELLVCFILLFIDFNKLNKFLLFAARLTPSLASYLNSNTAA